MLVGLCERIINPRVSGWLSVEEPNACFLQDAGKTVGVYKYECETLSWSFIGKYRSHYKDICSIFFVPIKHDSGTYKLLSIGNYTFLYSRLY